MTRSALKQHLADILSDAYGVDSKADLEVLRDVRREVDQFCDDLLRGVADLDRVLEDAHTPSARLSRP
jgi:hypothetical protein